MHYAIEIEPQHFTLAREEEGNDYFTRFSLQGEVTTEEGEAVYDFSTEPFLRLNQSDLNRVGARPFAYRGMFPLIAGRFVFRLILKNEARTEYTLFEDKVVMPEGAGPFLSRPLLLHGRPDPEAQGHVWRAARGRIVPNSPGVGALGTPITIAVAAPGHAEVRFRLHPWSADDSRSVPAVLTEDVAVEGGLALWSLATDPLDSGRYVLMAASGEEERSTTLDLIARRSVAVPWGLTDSFDPAAPGALPAALAEQWLRLGDYDVTLVTWSGLR